MLADSFPVRRAGRTAAITLPDEIDVTNAGQVRAALEQALAAGARVVAADLTRTRFCACQGVRALLETAQDAAAAGAELRVAAGGPAVRQVLELTGADRLLDTYPSVEAALEGPPAGTGAAAGSAAWSRNGAAATAGTAAAGAVPRSRWSRSRRRGRGA